MATDDESPTDDPASASDRGDGAADDAPADDAPPDDGEARKPATDAASDERVTGLKVADVVGKSQSQLEEELDPETVAQLAAWFGLPSFEQPTAAQPYNPYSAYDDPEARQRREEALASVAPAMIRYVERHLDAPTRIGLVRPEPKLRPPLPPSPVESEPPIALATTYEREIPSQLEEDLSNCVPQALLRDLHRTEFSPEPK